MHKLPKLVARILPPTWVLPKMLGYREVRDADNSDNKENTRHGDEPVIDTNLLDALVSSAYRNHSNRLLCLPNELLLQIMGHLDAISVFALERVSRKFSLLFVDNSLFMYHEPPDWTIKTIKSLWQRFDKTMIDGSRQNIRRWNRCSICRLPSIFKEAEVHSAAPPFIHCSGCIGDHPFYMFSVVQRQVPDADRICIGREGSIRLCQHKLIWWKDIEQLDLWAGSWANSEFEIRCEQCDSPYHVGGVPSLTVESKKGKISNIRFTKRTSIKFARRQSRITAKEMRQGIEGVFSASKAYWYPADPPSHLSPMRAFDPNVCSCLVYHGSTSIDWQLCEKDDPGHTFSCRKSGEVPNPSRDNHLISQYTHSFKSNIGVGPNRYLGMAFRRRSNFEVEMDQVMEMSLDSSIRALGPWMPQWYLALDPTSYSLTDDGTMHGVTWCRDKNCRNYFAIRSGIGRPEIATQDCGLECFSSVYGANSQNREAKDHVVRREIWWC